MARIDVPMSEEWSNCDHDWEEYEGNEPGGRDCVECTKCQCPGERWIKTGEVDWPTT